MELYLIKDGCKKSIEISDDIIKDIKNPHCEFLDKYVNHDNYSLVIKSSKDYELFTFINKNITKEDGNTILNTVRSICDKNNIFEFDCCNYLEDDYDYVNVFDKYKMENSIFLFCDEKTDGESYYTKKILTDYRKLNLEKCLLENYGDRFPNNGCRGAVIIGEDKRVDIGLNKRTHNELLDEYFKRDSDIKKDNSIVAIVSGCSIFIEIPNSINSFQKSELNKIKDEVNHIKGMHMPVYLDILKDGDLYKDFDDILGKQKRKSIR